MSTIKVADLQHLSNSNNSISIASDSSVALKHSGNAKLTTTATGIDVSGVCNATSFTGDASNLQTSASNLSSGIIPDARFPATLPPINGGNLTGISSGALEHVSDHIVPTGTTTTTIQIGSLSNAANILPIDTIYFLRGQISNNVNSGVEINIYPEIYDSSSGNTWNYTTGLSYTDGVSKYYSSYSGNQSSSYWQPYTGGYPDYHYHFEMVFSTFYGPSAYTRRRGIRYQHDITEGNHIWNYNAATSRIQGLVFQHQYGYSFDDRTKLSLYKYTNY
mgnify:CR=1 FL=1